MKLVCWQGILLLAFVVAVDIYFLVWTLSLPALLFSLWPQHGPGSPQLLHSCRDTFPKEFLQWSQSWGADLRVSFLGREEKQRSFIENILCLYVSRVEPLRFIEY